MQPNAEWVLAEKWLGHEAYHSPPPTSTSASPLLHPYAFMACRGTTLLLFYVVTYSCIIQEFITPKEIGLPVCKGLRGLE